MEPPLNLGVTVPDERRLWSDAEFAFAAIKELVSVEGASDQEVALARPALTVVQWGISRSLALPAELSGLNFGWSGNHLEEMIVRTAGCIHEMHRNMYNPASAVSDFHHVLSYMFDYADFRGWSLRQILQNAAQDNAT